MPTNTHGNPLRALKLFLLMVLLVGIIYPLCITVIAQSIAREKANGSIVYHQGKAVGSRLIAQKFSSDRYFWPRPSANNYDALNSGGSNLGATSQKLQQIVNERRTSLAQAHHVSGEAVPRELLFASGSGLDPDISLETVYFQLERVLQARGLNTPSDKKQIESILSQQFHSYRLSGDPYLNVLLLNQALLALEENKR